MRLPSIRNWTVALLLIGAAGYSGYLLATFLQQPTPTAYAPPSLRLAFDGNTLGELQEGETTVRSIVVENVSNVPVRISRLRGDCRCATFTPQSLELPPRGRSEVSVEIRLDTKEVQRDQISLLLVAEAKDQDGKDVTARWEVTGRIAKGVTVSTQAIDFGEVLDGGVSVIKRTVHLKAATRLDWVTASFTGDTFVGEPSRTIDGDFEIVVCPKESLSVGTTRATMTIQAKLKAAAVPVRFSIPTAIVVVSEVESVPERILAGRRKNGTTESQEWLLASRSGKEIKLLESGGDMGVSVKQQPESSGIRLLVSYTIVPSGKSTRVAWARVRIGGVPRVIELPILGYDSAD